MSSVLPPSNGPSKPSPTANVKPGRLPAPTLFVGPPSRNASQLSISRQQTHESSVKREPLTRGKSAFSRHTNLEPETTTAGGGRDGGGAGDTGGTTVHSALPPLKKTSEKDVDAKWKEMQSTLNEVELTAQSSTHVFGESHARALDELRRAQVELARAWGRGNDDKHDPTDMKNADFNLNRFKGADELAHERQTAHGNRARADTAGSTSTALSDESLRSDVTSKSGRGQLEDETAQDIKLASERRAANEAYFKKVDGGVRDVVAKLELVADAMRGVEGESRSLWSSSASSTSVTSEERLRRASSGRKASSAATAKG